jgi:beta-glucanase (GH16 family)
MLGTDIGDVGWPQCGEIDIMEYVSRLPNEVFGTIHGPGYSGGASFGNTYLFTEPVSSTFHTFAVEWQPDYIEWYVDGILYHTAEPDDVSPNEWVYNHPFYIILNLAIGGNFGGPVSSNMTYPQEMRVDYVRVYGAADTAERFEATFVDDFGGWKKITIPFDALTRSAEQPAGAPDDGLGLTEVWGYGFGLPPASSGSFYLDQVRLEVEVPLYRYYLPVIAWQE